VFRRTLLAGLAVVVTGSIALPQANGTEPLSHFIWRNSDKEFGGFSAIELSDDGRAFVALSDHVGRSFGVRVRRFGLDGTWGETVVETHTGTWDNLKGISVWRDGTGLIVTMILDDNFNRFQRTEIVEYRLPDGRLPD
jgi:hypothetical protein